MAGIENYNVMLYTSVLPPEALELSHLPDIHHGSVLEGIITLQHTDKAGSGSPLAYSWPRSSWHRPALTVTAVYEGLF
jgi:pyruvoyl-dependent arginine decarboxylase (PvlArgDC)